MSTDEMSTTDFSDFAHENTTIQWNANVGDFEQAVSTEFKPLESEGGLENDEIAELVALQVQGIAQLDGGGESDSSSLSTFEVRGGIGFNIDPNEVPHGAPVNVDAAGFPDSTDNRIRQIRAVNEAGQTDDQNNGQLEVFQTDEPALLYPFSFGGSASSGFSGHEIGVDVLNFRDTYGRGPIVDATDDWGVVLYAIKNGGTVAHDLEMTMRAVWDISEVEGVRSRFSLPGRVE